MVHIGHHDELTKDPAGAYSQLIRLQEAYQETDKQLSAGLSGSLSKRSQSLEQSIVRSSDGSSHHYVVPPVGLSGPTASLENDGEKQNENTDDKVSKKAPMSRLISLNKPETPLLLFGSLAAAIDGTILPVMGLVLASSAKTFYELPADKRQKDSIFWGLLCIGLGAIAMIARLSNSLLFAIAGGKLIERIRALTFQSIVYQEAAWFDQPTNSR
jgi:ATP-binding cassette subfamily B (MDR/TAP) protein 1